MKKVLVTMPDDVVRGTFFTEELRDYMNRSFDVTWNTMERQYSREELRQLLLHHDAVMTGWGTEMLDEFVLKDADRLKLIAHTAGSVGYLLKDDFAYRKGIRVFSGNRMFAESVAEGTVAYILAALRRIPDHVERVRAGGWESEQKPEIWEGLLDQTVGIVGFGTISRFLVPMLEPFRVKIKIYSHHPIEKEFLERYHCEQVGLEEIFSTCKIVSIHSALNDENRGLIKREHFRLLQDGAIFINTSRGAVVDEEAMTEELRTNRFRALLDVFVQEPLPAESELRKMKNVYPIPHMGGPTVDRRSRIAWELVREMQDFFDGKDAFELEITSDFAKRMTR